MGKEKNVKVYLPGGSGLEKSVADNYLWIIFAWTQLSWILSEDGKIF